MYYCHACQTELHFKHKPSRKDECPNCGMQLHCCLNCRFYASGMHNDCQETQADWVADKDRANFCDYFVFRESKSTPKEKTGGNNARLQFESLFKK